MRNRFVIMLICALTLVPFAGQGKRQWPAHTYGGGETLFYNEQTFHEVRQRVDREPWAEAILEKMRTELEADKPYKFMGRSLWWNSQWCRDAAVYYRITGEESYLDKAVGLVVDAFNLDKPETPLFKPRDSHNTYYWSWCVYRGGCFLAYDLLRNHPLMKPYAAAMEQRLGEIIAEGYLYSKGFNRYSNTQIMAMVYGVGMPGFMKRDREAIRYMIDGPYGYKAILEAFRDEGRYFPEPIGYTTNYVANCLTMLAEAARFNGLEDLYNYTAPNGASLRRMVDGFISMSDPSGMAFSNGDHGMVGFADEGKVFYGGASIFTPEVYRTVHKWELYNARLPDPRYAWVISQNPARDWKCMICWGYTGLMFGASIEDRQAPDAPCVRAPEMGDVILRSDETPAYWGSDSPAVHFRNGASQRFHSNHDHFHFTMYAHGKHIYPDWFLNWDYLSPRKSNRNANATPLSMKMVAHNTVVVDCREPDIQTMKLPSLNPEVPGVAFSQIVRHPDGMNMCSAEGEIFAGVRQKRTLGVTREYVLDIFEIRSDTPHTYDYVLHSFGDVSVDGVGGWSDYPQLNDDYKLAPIDKFSKREDNMWFYQARKTSTDRDLVFRFADTDSKGAYTTVLSEKGSGVMTAKLPFMVTIDGGLDATERAPWIPLYKPMVMVRRTVPTTTFYALHQPFTGATEKYVFKKKGDRLIVSSTEFTDTYDLKTNRYKRTKK